MLRAPILVIEDDQEDAQLITEAIKANGITNAVTHFSSAADAFKYLLSTTEQPLIIISDIRMPGLDGLSLLKNIVANDYLRDKAIPYVFLTALSDDKLIREAFRLSVQGYFRKASTFQGLKDQLLSILIYWRGSLHPNTPSL